MDEKGSGAMINEQNEFGVLFYINAFSNGVIFNTNEIKQFLDELKFDHRRILSPVQTLLLSKECLQILFLPFKKLEIRKVEELKILRNIIEGI